MHGIIPGFCHVETKLMYGIYIYMLLHLRFMTHLFTDIVQQILAMWSRVNRWLSPNFNALLFVMKSLWFVERLEQNLGIRIFTVMRHHAICIIFALYLMIWFVHILYFCSILACLSVQFIS